MSGDVRLQDFVSLAHWSLLNRLHFWANDTGKKLVSCFGVSNMPKNASDGRGSGVKYSLDMGLHDALPWLALPTEELGDDEWVVCAWELATSTVPP